MNLPEYVLDCIQALESRGFEAWAVGGCVRDQLLGLAPKDYDLTTSALPEQTEQVFAGHKLVLAGEHHGTVGVVTDAGVVEITTFRTEGSYRDSRHPDWVKFVPELALDLARRDFTVNAMAYSPTRGFADPFGGREDLEKRILRTVGEPERRFREDALRIFRGIRFAARYDLEVEQATWQAMVALAPETEHLARERVFSEVDGFLLAADRADILAFGPILAQAIPELGPCMGFDQHSPHHAYDLFTHIAWVVDQVPREQTLRWAALLHDIGKVPTFTRDETGRGHFYGHDKAGAAMAREVLRRLRAPGQLIRQVPLLIEKHMTKLPPEAAALKRQLNRLGRDTLEQLLCLQQADMASKGVQTEQDLEQFAAIRQVLARIYESQAAVSLRDLAIRGDDLLALGYRGREVGQCLNELLEQVMTEQLPNEKPALTAWAADRTGQKKGESV